MKRLLLSAYLLSIVVFYGYSQSISLSNSNGVIAPNATLIQAGTPDSNALSTYINVKNIGGSKINVLCRKYELKMLDSTEITMCWAGSCYPASTFISPNAQAIAPEEIITDFVGHYSQIVYNHFISGESVVRWVFYDRGNLNDTAAVTIKYTTYPLGIEESGALQATLSNAYPNPADATVSFNYSVPSGLQGTLFVRNILGTIVKTQVLAASNRKTIINTLDMNDGIYFCSLLVDGKISQTKKLIVQH